MSYFNISKVDIPMLFEKVKSLAKQRKVSLNQIEEQVGLSKNSLYSLKRSKPNPDVLLKLADYFNVSTDYLLGREQPNSQVMYRLNTDGLANEDMEEFRKRLAELERMLRNDILERKRRNGKKV